MNIKILEIIEEYENNISEKVHGIYKISLNDKQENIIVRNGDVLYKLSHTIDKPILSIIKTNIGEEIIDKLSRKI